MAIQWYYADANGQQVGPIPAEELRAAVARGAANAATLAWRDGLPDWKPLSELAAELQLDLGENASPPPPPPAAAASVTSNPYSAPETLLPEANIVLNADDVVYAGFWSRFAARTIDHIVVSVPVTFVGAFIVGGATALIAGNPTADDAGLIGAVILFYLLPIAANYLYFAVMESSGIQASLGKLALGIKVTDADGDRLTFSRASLRWFAAFLSWATLCIGFVMAAFTERKRALHDMLASTLVVDKWAYTSTPERQQRGMSGCLIAFLVVFALLFVLVPILAAISVGQFRQYMGT
jgi:uncharacterized RDD family membrane protein YckC